MYLKLIRNKPQGKALFGQLYVDGEYFCDTLENTDYAIPTGFYRLRVTMSPRFRIYLPLLDGVWGYRKDYVGNDNTDNLRGNQYPCHAQSEHNPLSINTSTLRTGIRIHAGNIIQDTEGCILVGKADVGDEAMRLLGEEAKGKRLLSSLKTLHRLCDILLYQQNYTKDETYIEVSEPDLYPLYDVPCPPEEQER